MKDEKILQDELMSDEELDQVAGGNCYQMADDSRFLNSLNGSCDRYGATRIFFSNVYCKEIEKAWSTVGITATLSNEFVINEYCLNGKIISQEEARQHAMNVVGKQMTESDWKW